MNSRDKPCPLLPDPPKNKLLFEDAPPAEEAPATSGQIGQKSKRRGKLHLEKEQSRPSERLRHEKSSPDSCAAIPGAENSRPSPPPSAETSHAPPTPGAATAAPDGEASADGATAPKPDKKLLREDKRLSKSKLRMEKTGDKLGVARDKLAAQKPPKKPGVIKKTGKLLKSEAWMAVHGKVYQVEHENVGIKAAHRSELAGEGLVRGVSRFVKRRIRTRPARRVRKWERKDTKARADFNFRQAAKDNPELNKKSFYRQARKKRNQKQFRDRAREAARTTGTLAKKTAAAVGKAGRAVVQFAVTHPAVMIIILSAFLLMVVLQSCAGGALSIGNGILGAIGGTSYMAEDGEINGAEIAYSEWEVNLLEEAQNAESSHPGYDEYRYYLDSIGHDPIALISFLTAKYDDFTFAMVEPVLRDIFNQQYSLTFTEIVEVRSYEETWTDEDGEEHTETIYYDYYILEVTLTARPFADIIGAMLEAGDEQDRYDVYNTIKGNRQYVGSPFPYNWLPYVSSNFGWRVHPITGEKDFHRGIDIALPAGTQIFAGGEGVVVESTTHSLYGLTVKIDYGNGVEARYSHCSALLVNVGQTVIAGDAIALVGSTGASTGPHLDLEVLKDGELMNPLYFVVIPL